MSERDDDYEGAPENAPALWHHLLPRAAPDQHKYSRGAVLVLSGDESHSGAARLAAAAALRCGAGLVTIASPARALAINAGYLAALIVRPCEDEKDFAALLEDGRVTAAVVGPGAGVAAATAGKTLAALASRAAVVIDADAVTSFRDAPDRLFGAIQGRAAATLLTPHAGEFARLFPDLAGDASRQRQARAAAERSGAVIVLKGARTVIAAPDGRLVVNGNAPPHLATAGSGDVLCGIAAALLAGGMSGFEAAAAAVFVHGAAGERAGWGLIADDLPTAARAVLAALIAGLAAT
jgi:hydroxyethylthiazole kinase-like uncharacterized protein yjeF